MLDSILLRIARTAILNKFDSRYKVNREALIKKYPYLEQEGATFITLNYDQRLRGCIGSIIAHRPLIDDIINNALSAAYSDPRFSPLHTEELSHINLEVSVLSTPEILEYSNFDDLLTKIRPHIDGLILNDGLYRGTFLPQVWEELSSPKEFLEHLSYKSGANPSIYQEHPTIYRYTVDAIKESFDAILPL